MDWEISGALNYKVGDHYAGLLGIVLPNHPDYEKPIHERDISNLIIQNDLLKITIQVMRL